MIVTKAKKIRCTPRPVKHVVRYLDAGGNTIENPPEQLNKPGRPLVYDNNAEPRQPITIAICDDETETYQLVIGGKIYVFEY